MRAMSLMWIAAALFAAPRDGLAAPPAESAQAKPAAELGGPPTTSGTLTADSGDIDWSTFFFTLPVAGSFDPLAQQRRDG